MGVPPKKISIFFPEIFCQHIDRKSKKISNSFAEPFDHEYAQKKCIIGLVNVRTVHLAIFS